MVENPRSSFARLLGAAALLPICLAWAQTEGAQSDKTLPVPEEEAAKGKVYYVLPGKDAQVTFTSDAPLEHIKGTSNQVVGYVVVAEKEGQEGFDIVSGAFRLPVKSLDTGIPLRNEHLQGERWLNVADHPDISYKITNVTKPSEVKKDDAFTTYGARIVGEMTVNGQEKKLSAGARITRMPASEKTRARAPGDLMAIRCSFKVELSDYGMDAATAGDKIANEIEIDTFLMLSTVKPE
jgi:polyisoprenoid-binding protein YceI